MVNRRDVLRGVGSWSVLRAGRSLFPGLVAGLTACCRRDKYKKLNVILHGLFVVNVREKDIQLLTPDLGNEHIYRAGNWRVNTSNETTSIVELGHKDYQLIGVKGVDQRPTFGHEGLVLDRVGQYSGHKVDPRTTRFTIKLPFPEEVHFRRSFTGPNLYSGTSINRGLKPAGLSLCTIFVYSCCDDLGLSGSEWKPDPPQGKGKYVNLHLWAEPETRVSPVHTAKAYRALMKMLPDLDFTIDIDDSPPLDYETGISGFPRDQEQGWAEWQSYGEGSRPTNCNAAVSTAGTSST